MSAQGWAPVHGAQIQLQSVFPPRHLESTTGPSLAFPQPPALFKRVTMQQRSTRQKPLLMLAATGAGGQGPQASKRPDQSTRGSAPRAESAKETPSLVRGLGAALSLGAGAERDEASTCTWALAAHTAACPLRRRTVGPNFPPQRRGLHLPGSHCLHCS